MDNLFEDLKTFQNSNGDKLLFLKYLAPNSLQVWDAIRVESGERITKNRIINIDSVSQGELEKIEVWGQLSERVRQDFDKKIVKKKIGKIKLMANARASRKDKYPGIPRVIKCIECGEDIKVSPGVIFKKAEKKKILVIDIISGFKCQKCHPVKRGRPKNVKV